MKYFHLMSLLVSVILSQIDVQANEPPLCKLDPPMCKLDEVKKVEPTGKWMMTSTQVCNGRYGCTTQWVQQWVPDTITATVNGNVNGNVKCQNCGAGCTCGPNCGCDNFYGVKK